METLNTVIMYWGYFSAFCFLCGLLLILPIFRKSTDSQTPYMERQKYFDKKKRIYESN